MKKFLTFLVFLGVTVFGQLSYVSRAADNANNYATWTNGSNAGTGFNAWAFTNSSGGQFLGSAYATSIDVSGKSFGVWGNPAGANYGRAKRTFSSLKENEKLTFKMSTAYRNGNKGVDILSGTTVLFNIKIAGDQYSYQNMNGGSVVNMDATYSGTMAFTITVEKKSGSDVSIEIVRNTGTGLTATNFTLSSSTIDGLEFYVIGTGNTASDNLYFNSLDISYPKFTSTTNGDWNTAGTWGGTAPYANSVVEINNSVSVNSAVTNYTNSVTINSGKTLTFGASGTLSVDGNFTATGSLNMTSGGTLTFGGSSVLTVAGTSTFNNVVLNCGVNFGASSTLNGMLTLKTGGYISTNQPTYATNSTLEYNNVVGYGVSAEWANTNSPKNVTLTSSSITLPTTTRTVSGILNIGTGSQVNMSLTSGGDLVLLGNLVNDGTLNPNGRLVTFNGSSLQTISGSATTTFGYLTLTNDVSLSSNISVSNTLSIGASKTLTCNAQSITIGGGGTFSNSGTFSAGTGKVIFSTGGISTVSGTVGFNNVDASGGVNFGTASTVNGTLTIYSGGYVSTNAPIYATNSTLKYYINSTYDRYTEWLSASGRGLPYNVQLSNNTILNLASNGGTAEARSINGTLTIDAGSTLRMQDLNNVAMSNTLTVVKDVLNNGTLNLSTASGGDLNVKGNFTNNGTFTANSRLVSFNGTSNQTIAGSGTGNFAYVDINNSTGVTLSRSLTIDNQLKLSTGNVTLGSNSISLGSSSLVNNAGVSTVGSFANTNMIIAGGSGTLNRVVGSSQVVFPIGYDATYYNPVAITNSGTSQTFQVKSKATPNSAGLNSKYVNCFWTITPVVATGVNCTLLFEWLEAQQAVGFTRDATTHIGRYSGTAWIGSTATLAGSNPYTASATGFTAFSEFGVGSNGALPVELVSFEASIKDGSVNLNWQTATEVSNNGFEVERKFAATEWSKIGFVEGHGTSNSPKYYTYSDKPLNSGKYSYRLKQIDNDGTSEYSPTVEVLVDNIPNGFVLDQNYPNPFNPETSIRFALKEDTKATIKVYNSLGSEVVTLFDGVADAGRYYDLKFGAKDLASGLYFYKLVAGDFVSVKKMLLMK